jgi:hypothetical protein
MNTFNKNSFMQKMFKGAVMIIILLQTACAAKITKRSGEPNGWTTPNPSQLAASGSGAALIYSADMPGEDSAWPEVQPIAQGDAHKGARIVLLLHNQQKIAGHLLSVRDSALVISTNEKQDNYSETHTAGILVVKNLDIQRVIIKGKSKILKGMKLGLQMGAKGGFEANNDSPCSEASPLTPCWGAALKPVIGGIVFGGAGMIMGGIVGAAVSKADKVIDPAMNQDFSALKPLAQFPEEEPEYLSAIK